ncbi:unnamed protein product [Rotaria sp. Silwood1]|nr:unnamed protein product [Rotaria sp. Silwood1]CAF3709554.1 unnamed protein product [Rotaria sp. Silwood1]CAF4665399.1 unnamed protein product [Rotaria sp. Silwood1]CAF4668419.1 unnamed protein product [Rotaria sp. Silwood1]
MIKNRKLRTLLSVCRICGIPTEHSNFGVISCNSCKMFFKRNASVGQGKLICRYNGECEININNRHICTSCRLNKCFETGMNTDKFRASRSKIIKTNNLVQINVQHQPDQLLICNILSSNQLLLTTNQWSLLTNLFNDYKESTIFLVGQRLIDMYDSLQSTNFIHQMLVEEFLSSIYETTGTYLRSNDNFYNLSSDDRPILLRSAAQNVSCMSMVFAMEHFHLFSSKIFSNTIEKMYGKYSITLQLLAMKYLDPDIILMKLAISLFTFSENTYSFIPNILKGLTNPINIFKIQNKYAEITWKYLLYKYDHYQAVKRFLNLISWLEATSIFMFHSQNLTLHINDINSLVQQTEFRLLLDDVDRIVEMND